LLSDPIFHSFIHKKKGIGRVGEKRDRGRGSKGTYYFAKVEKRHQKERTKEKTWCEKNRKRGGCRAKNNKKVNIRGKKGTAKCERNRENREQEKGRTEGQGKKVGKQEVKKQTLKTQDKGDRESGREEGLGKRE
jgi:hypothetical protein